MGRRSRGNEGGTVSSDPSGRSHMKSNGTITSQTSGGGGSSSRIQSSTGSRTQVVTVSTSKTNVVYPPAIRKSKQQNMVVVSGGGYAMDHPQRSNRDSYDDEGTTRQATARSSSKSGRATARHVSRHSLQEAYNHDENEENARIAHLVHIGNGNNSQASSGSSTAAQSPAKELPPPTTHTSTSNTRHQNGHSHGHHHHHSSSSQHHKSTASTMVNGHGHHNQDDNNTTTTRPIKSNLRSHTSIVKRDPDPEPTEATTKEDRDRSESAEARPCDKYGFFIDVEKKGNKNDDNESSDDDDDDDPDSHKHSIGTSATANGVGSRSRARTQKGSSPRKSTSQEPKMKLSDLERVKRREKKWAKMLRDNAEWDMWIRRRWIKVRDRCRKGIPDSVRGKAWFYLCGGHLLRGRNPRLFAQLDRERGDESIVEEIKRDLHRQFPHHEMFAQKDGAGQRDLFRILKAFAVLRPEVGYCQAQAPIAAVLLMQMPAEDAFWSLIAICDHFLPNYFSPGLEAVQIHGDMLNALIKRYASYAYKCLKRNSVEPVLYMCEWFMCIFSRSLPWGSVLRVWDMFLCEGVIVVFKAAIAILSTTLTPKHETRCSSLYDIVETLKHLPPDVAREEVLIDRLLKVELNDKRLIEEHKRQEKRRKKVKIAEQKRREKEAKDREREKEKERERQEAKEARDLEKAKKREEKHDKHDSSTKSAATGNNNKVSSGSLKSPKTKTKSSSRD